MTGADRVIATGAGIGGTGILAGITLGQIQATISIVSGIIILVTVILYYISLFNKVSKEKEIMIKKDQEGSELTERRIAAANAALKAKEAELLFWKQHGHAPKSDDQ